MEDLKKEQIMLTNMRYLINKYPNVRRALQEPVIISGRYLVGQRQRVQIDSIKSVFKIITENKGDGEVYHLSPTSYPDYKIPFESIHGVFLVDKIEPKVKKEELCMTA